MLCLVAPIALYYVQLHMNDAMHHIVDDIMILLYNFMFTPFLLMLLMIFTTLAGYTIGTHGNSCFVNCYCSCVLSDYPYHQCIASSICNCTTYSDWCKLCDKVQYQNNEHGTDVAVRVHVLRM